MFLFSERIVHKLQIIGLSPRPASKKAGLFFCTREHSMKIKLNPEGTIKDALPSVLAARIVNLKYHDRQIICILD